MSGKAGRPTKLTPERRDRLLIAIKHGATITMACHKTSINPRTFRYWRQQDEDFAAAVQAAQREYIQRLGSRHWFAVSVKKTVFRTVLAPQGSDYFPAARGDPRNNGQQITRLSGVLRTQPTPHHLSSSSVP